MISLLTSLPLLLSLSTPILLNFLFLLQVVSSVPPQVTTAFRTVRHETLLGAEIKIAVFELEFDQDLYFTNVLYCTPTECQEFEDEDWLPCDYTQKGEFCGTQKRKGNSSEIRDCEFKEDWCSNYEWTILEPGKWSEQVLAAPLPAPVHYFRFQFDNPCHGFEVSMDTASWTPGLMLSSDGPEVVPGLEAQTEVIDHARICPRSWNYKLGTWFLYPFGGKAVNIKVRIEIFEVENASVEIQPAQNCDDNPYQRCLELGVPYDSGISYPLVQIPFRFTATKCSFLVWTTEVITVPDGRAGISETILGINQQVYLWEIQKFFLITSGSLVFTVCPSETGDPVQIFLSVAGVSNPLGYLCTLQELTPETEPNLNVRRTRIDDFPIGTLFQSYFQGAFELDCGNQHFDCEPGAQYLGYSCLAFFPVVPLEDPDVFAPLPAFWHYASAGEFNLALSFVPSSVSSVSNKVVWAFLLNYQSGSNVFSPYNSTQDPLDTCVLQTRNIQTLTNLEGESIQRGTVSVVAKEMECDLGVFRNLSREIDEKIESMHDPNVDVIATRFEVDSITFLKGWQGCEGFIESFLSEVRYNQTLIDSTDCTNEMYLDPILLSQDNCCNQQLRWTQCCQPRNVTTSFATKFLVPSPTQDSEKSVQVGQRPISQCQNSDCFRSLLQDYASFLSQENSDQSCEKGIQNQQLLETKNLEFYRNCKFEYFGDDHNGRPCYSDDDCKVRCDLINQKCVYDSPQERDLLVNGFFDCLSVNMSEEQTQYVVKVMSIDSQNSDIELNQLISSTLRESYLNSPDCWDHSGISGTHGTRYVVDLPGNYCPPCPNFSCLDASCRYPLRCENGIPYGRVGTICTPILFGLVSNESSCLSDEYCTFDADRTQSECPLNINFCAICETPDNCVQVQTAGTQDECEQMNVCVLANGTIIENISQEECENYGSCVLPDGITSVAGRNLSDIVTAEQCLNIGYCSDKEWADYLVQVQGFLAGREDFESARANWDYSLCVFQMNAWNNVDCFNRSTPVKAYPFSDRCLTYPDLCFGKPGGYVRDASFTKEECEVETTCEEDNFIPTLLTSPKDPEQCQLCDGKSILLWEWIPGKWMPGTIRKGRWMTSEWKSRQQWIPNSIDFVALNNLFQDSFVQKTAFQLQTELQCRQNPKKQMIEQLVCLCGTDNSETETEQACLQGQEVPIGVAEPCSSVETQVYASPALLFFDTQSVKKNCVKVELFSALSQNVKKSSPPKLAVSFRKQSSTNEPVKNENGVAVGRIYSNGVRVVVSVEGSGGSSTNETTSWEGEFSEVLGEFELCFDVVEAQTSTDKGEKFDFGIKVSSDEVRPMGLEITMNSHSQLCSWLTYDQEFTIFPVVVQDNWQSEDNSLDSTGKGIFSFVGTLYLILFLWFSYKESRLGTVFRPTRLVSLFILLAYLVRGIDMILYAAETIGTASSDSGTELLEFLLVEIPTTLYLMSVSVLGFACLSILRSVEKKKFGINGKILLIFGPLLVFCWFVVIIILFIELANNSSDYSCGGRIYVEPDHTKQRNVSIVYRIFSFVFSLVIGLVCFYQTYRVLVTVKTNDTRLIRVQRTQFLLTVSGVGSMIAQSIFFLWLYNSSESQRSPPLTLILIPIEMFPLTFIIYTLTNLTPIPSSSSGTNRSVRMGVKSSQNSAGPKRTMTSSAGSASM